MPQDHEDMRNQICNSIFGHPEAERWFTEFFKEQEDEFQSFISLHSTVGEWTDDYGIICQATAYMLKRRIQIVHTTSIEPTMLDSVSEAQFLPPLTVGYYQGKHYHSLEYIGDLLLTGILLIFFS